MFSDLESLPANPCSMFYILFIEQGNRLIIAMMADVTLSTVPSQLCTRILALLCKGMLFDR